MVAQNDRGGLVLRPFDSFGKRRVGRRTGHARFYPLVVSLWNHERKVVAPPALRQAQGERERYV